ncbi:MAG TPA: acetate--CoA ligase [bacterium]|nr:acetate--CoA ligase [bacterium]
MAERTIRKNADGLRVPPNLTSYAAAVREFSWEEARRRLDGLPGGRGLNIAHEAVVRHARGPKADKTAIRFLRKDGRTEDWTYRALDRASNRFANVLRKLGVGRGDRVFTLLGRTPELFVAALGTLKNGSVLCPLFSAFGPEPLKTRLTLGEGKVLVTTEAFQARKVAPIRAELPMLREVILTGASWDGLLEAASPDFEIPPTNPEDVALLHFTSGTTGRPKGAVHVHEAVVAHHVTGLLALDFHDDDVFWCTADPGWVTGTSYGIVSPLTNGVTMVVDEGEFDAGRWYRVLEEQAVTVWYTAPTAVRMMMRGGTDLPRQRNLSRLRFIASVGEPLNPEAVLWGVAAFGLPIHDNWWQTETGGIMIANYASMDIRPGSMGRPLPGITAAVARRTADGRAEVLEEPGVQGELVLKAGWPSMFRGYLNETERFQKCFADGWYFTGDLARRDADGYYWFVGRSDDVIKSAGHLIGPFEVESALMEHPSVAEAAVIGKPDPLIGETVKAFVGLKADAGPSEGLRKDILGFARQRLGPAVAPKEIEFVTGLPKTKSGKILRRLLKARELGLPEGDLSTLEEAP